MFKTGDLVRDVGTVLVGKDAVAEGIIDDVGGVSSALRKLKELTSQRALRSKQGEESRLVLYTVIPGGGIGGRRNSGGLAFAMTVGGKLLAAPEGPGQGRIIQLLSTDPADFLDPLVPGNMIIWLKRLTF